MKTFIVSKTKPVLINTLISNLKKAKKKGVKAVSFEDHISPPDSSGIDINITDLGARLNEAGLEDLADELEEVFEEDEDGPEEYLEDLGDAYDIEEENLENQDDQDAFFGKCKKHKKK